MPPNKRKITSMAPSTSLAKKAKTSAISGSTGSISDVSIVNQSARAKSGKSRKTRRSQPAGFYQSGSGTTSTPPTQQNLNKLFDQYRDKPKESPDRFGIEGAQKYLTDLNVELDEVAHLAICDLLQCPSIGEFEREPFISGWRSVSSGSKQYDSTATQAQYVDVLRKKVVSDPAYFKQVYRNAFKLAKPEGQRSVPMDSAIDFWNMFFRSGKGGIEWSTASTKWLDLWCTFYESHTKRPVNKDLWNMVGELVTKTRESGGESLEWWKEDGAWPMAIDDFVAYVKDKRKSDGDTMDTS
ncbi:Scaffold-type E3 ligase [Elasticomyces elasticus]|uniref:Defective in cullin neddylation protein n=1 Tax=Exophiala sideris TaxID=1016849 RepID=A0ABR0J294_9EURO|nr:Scaffold-type E3 ligase [Elasticomyces elasticus]KAK5024723.1 Scaffold-type E3 ligase [Exophiala sideris]KAK5030816.1 Scaffold-type E3 ligase [Exophiala sideris]KAK5054358.1 Scaffold-type E3 ligase [Exophiala sideris]KAK5179758.1 Scaffold-type E3 ligase [Eurotiomycetes sp. CCFEE 6388]